MRTRVEHNTNSQIKFKTKMLCAYSDSYIFVKRKITVNEARATPRARQAVKIKSKQYPKIVHRLPTVLLK